MVMPFSRITLSHLAISAFSSAPSSAGDVGEAEIGRVGVTARQGQAGHEQQRRSEYSKQRSVVSHLGVPPVSSRGGLGSAAVAVSLH